jgi:hypothetical protein
MVRFSYVIADADHGSAGDITTDQASSKDDDPV